MNTLILSLFLSVTNPGDSTVVIPKAIAVKVYKDLLELRADRIELRLKDSTIVVYQERVIGKDSIISELKLNAKDYKTIIGDLQLIIKDKDVEIKTLHKKNVLILLAALGLLIIEVITR